MLDLDDVYMPNVRGAGRRYVDEAKTKTSARRAEKCADKCVCTPPRRAAPRAAAYGPADRDAAGSYTTRL